MPSNRSATTTQKKRAPAAVKAAGKATAKPSQAAAAKPAAPKVRQRVKPSIPAEQRANYVEVAAYYIAERRGFAPGDPLADWIEAEAEIDRLLASGHFGKD